MTTPAKINFKVYQGSTFSEVLRWESSSKGYKTITGISNTAPVPLASMYVTPLEIILTEAAV